VTPQDVADLYSLKDRTVVVSGGARGIGAAVSRTLHGLGAHVVIADLLEEEGRAVAAELGERARFERLNVTDEANWEALISEATAWRGSLDVLVNCAAIAVMNAITEFPQADFQRVLDVNLIGVFLGVKHAGRVMREQGRGSIINFSSADGTQGANSMGAYAASKWAVRGMSKVAAMELGLHGVRVNTICPGPVNTPMLNPRQRPAAEIAKTHPWMTRMPLQRIAEPIELAAACGFLASDAASFVTGVDLMVDGGGTIGMYYPHLAGGPGVPPAA